MTMNPTAQRAAKKSSRIAHVSAPGFGARFGTVRSASLRGFGRLRPRRSTSPATSESRALLTAKPLADDDAEADERDHAEEPGDEALRHRTDVAERPAAAVVDVLRVQDVGDDRVQLRVADRLLREGRHDVRPDPDGLGD